MNSPVRSVSQAFAILRTLAEHELLTLSEIGREAGISPSSCLNLLKALMAEGAVERREGSRQYRLAQSWDNADILRTSRSAGLIDRVRPLLARFAREAEAAAGLWKIVSRDRMQLVFHAESDSGMRLSLADDQRQPLGNGAAGRAIAAVQKVNQTELARRFSGVRWQTDLSFELYERQVLEAGTNGFAIDEDDAHRGVCTVAVGIADIAPGFCLSASIVARTRSAADVRDLGFRLVALKDEAVL